MAQRNITSSKSRILIVDNDPDIRLLMKEALLGGDYIFDDVSSGHEALSYINSRAPDAVLLSANISDMSSFEVCAKICKKHDGSNLAIIMVTDLDDAKSIELAFQQGATDFIKKPINWNTFPYRIQYALKARTAFNELKERERHLRHMERISRIISQSENCDYILQNALEIMTDIFNADRAAIISLTKNKSATVKIIYEALRSNIQSLRGNEDDLAYAIKTHNNITDDKGSALITHYTDPTSQTGSLNSLGQMLFPLQQQGNEIYYLALHHCNQSLIWTDLDKQTFKDISERLGAILSQHLLSENLHQSENLLRQAQHLGHLGNWHWDIQNKTIIWSDEVFKIYGKDITNFKPSFEFMDDTVHKDDKNLLDEFKHVLSKTEDSHSVEYRIIRPNGNVRYIYQQGSSAFNSLGKLNTTHGTIQDITEYKLMTMALLESEARFRRMAENAPDVIFRITLTDENFEYVSPASTKLFGYSPNEFKDISWLIENVITSENKKSFLTHWVETKQGENITGFEYSIHKKSNEVRWLNQRNVLIMAADNTTPIAVEGIISDVTIRRRMDEKLLNSERDMRGILSNLQDTFFRINQFGSIIMASESVKELLHWAPFSLLGTKFNDLFITLDEYDEFTEALDENHGHLVSYQVRMKRQDNEIRWVSLSMQASEDSSGYIEGTARDVTDKLRQQEQEAHDQKMEAIGQLTSGVAHDFGNLMTIAKGNLELLNDICVDTFDGKSEPVELLDDARSAITDGIGLTRQLLAFSRKKAIKPISIDPGETINGFNNLFQNTLGDRIRLDINIQPNLSNILVDPVQFESALINIVINARDAMPDGGKLLITAITKQASAANSESVIITLKDDGSGMSDETIKRAIEPFYTTKQNEGTGLGLSMVYGFMQQSNGDLNINSAIGKGTSMEMMFPAFYGKRAQPSKKSVQKIVPLSTNTVLVVEDREAVRRFAIRCLNKLKLNILEADNATDAQNILIKNENIHLLFSDILMPGKMNGRELAIWARDNFPNLKILLTTAAEKEVQLLGDNDEKNFPLLQKPYSPVDLIKKIQGILQ